MKKFAVISAAALIGIGALTSSAAQARGGGAVAAGIIGGLAAGALLGAAVSDAHAAPYGYARPAYGYAPPAYGYAPAPVAYGYRPAPVVRAYDEVPVYETRRVVTYAPAPVAYGYRPAPPRWHDAWQETWHAPYGGRGW